MKKLFVKLFCLVVMLMLCPLASVHAEFDIWSVKPDGSELQNITNLDRPFSFSWAVAEQNPSFYLSAMEGIDVCTDSKAARAFNGKKDFYYDVLPFTAKGFYSATMNTDTLNYDLALIDLATKKVISEWALNSDRMPSVSPNGRYVVYTVEKGDADEQYILDLQTNEKVQIPSSRFSDYHIWNPDSKEFATVDQDMYITIVSTTGTTKKLIKEGFSTPLAWSPNGKYLLAADFEESVYIMDVQSQKKVCSIPTPLKDTYNGVWSPDNTTFALIQYNGEDVVDGSSIWLGSLKGDIQKIVSFDKESSLIQISWSSDGKALYFERDLGNDNVADESKAATDFKNLTWGMSPEEVEEAEVADNFLDESDETLYYYDNVYDLDGILCYSFDQDQLCSAFYMFQQEYTDNNDYLNDFEKIHEDLLVKFGQPVIDRMEWTNQTYQKDSSKWGYAISLGHALLYCTWETENSEIELMLFGQDNTCHLVLGYSSLEIISSKAAEENE